MNPVVRDADEARPWRADSGTPAPDVRVYPPGHRPALRIRVAGRWHHCPVHARHDHADGRVAYQVQIELIAADGIPGHYIRTYWWDPAAMRPAD